jgi:hypothetical protein
VDAECAECHITYFTPNLIALSPSLPVLKYICNYLDTPVDTQRPLHKVGVDLQYTFVFIQAVMVRCLNCSRMQCYANRPCCPIQQPSCHFLGSSPWWFWNQDSWLDVASALSTCQHSPLFRTISLYMPLMVHHQQMKMWPRYLCPRGRTWQSTNLAWVNSIVTRVC